MELLWRGVGVEGRGDYRAASVPRDDPRMWGQEALKLGDIAEDEVEDLRARAKQGVGLDTSVTRDSQKEFACCMLVKGWWR